MNDREILNWIENHLTALRENMDGEFEMKWTDDNGVQGNVTVGSDLRSCVNKAKHGVK